jgi:hypothetical protein
VNEDEVKQIEDVIRKIMFDINLSIKNIVVRVFLGQPGSTTRRNEQIYLMFRIKEVHTKRFYSNKSNSNNINNNS